MANPGYSHKGKKAYQTDAVVKKTPYGSLSRTVMGAVKTYLASAVKERKAKKAGKRGPSKTNNTAEKTVATKKPTVRRQPYKAPDKGKLSDGKVEAERKAKLAKKVGKRGPSKTNNTAPKTLAAKQPTVGTIPARRVASSVNKAGYKDRKAELARQDKKQADDKAPPRPDSKSRREPTKAKRRYGLLGRRSKEGSGFKEAIARHLG